jgi:hypothetical protein
MISKKILVPVMTLVVGSSIVLGATYVSAQDETKPTDSLVTKIAQKFGLKPEEVQSVFDEHHTEMKAQMKLKFEDRLTQMVSEGKLTEAQKSAIIAKLDELKTERENYKERFKAMSPEERKAELKNKRTELEAWAKEQGIDLSIFGGIFFGHHKGVGPRKMILH